MYDSHFLSTNPTNGQLLQSFPTQDLSNALSQVSLSYDAFQVWQRSSLSEREKKLIRMAEYLEENKQTFAEIISLEMGKIIKEAVAEVEKCALLCRYYSEHSSAFLAEQKRTSSHQRTLITFQPLGVILAIMPWNFPFWQTFRCAIPAITAGNGVILKHAENVPRCALELEKIFLEADYPKHLFKSLLVSRHTTNLLLEHDGIKALSFTGSVEAGQKVAQKASQQLKKAVLELGGSDPYLVLSDADLDLAASKCVESRLINAGQSCIAAKRFIVVKEVAADFTERVFNIMKRKQIGSPFDSSTDLGPLARADLRAKLQRQVDESIHLGADCLLGGKIPNGPGFFYPPTILTKVTKGMPAYEEELFGPVMAIIWADDEQEAVSIANDSVFGLGAGIFTKDQDKGEMIAKKFLQAGFCAVNDYVRSDPSLPFGGVKKSGYGRELSEFGMQEFVNIKTLTIN